MSSRFYFLRSVVLLVWMAAPHLCQADDEIALTLPSEFYGVVGEPTAVYFDNVVLARDSGQLQFKAECEVGTVEAKAWKCTPSKSEIGRHKFSIEVQDSNGKRIAVARSTVVVSQPASRNSRRVLVVGDSLTHASQYPNELYRLYAQHHKTPLVMLGTHHPGGASDNVNHEGYGGWTWQRFATKYEPNPDGTYRKRSSPFVFLNDDSKPTLDVARYVREHCQSDPPDVVFFMLGINDCFSAPTDDQAAMDARITQALAHGETLIEAFHKAAPDTDLAICLTTPGNSRDGAFVANYQDRYPRWGWKQIQHRLVIRQLKQYQNREKERIYIVPTQLNLDVTDGYPDNNAVHPNAVGYKQIGSTLFAWLEWRETNR